MKGPRGHGVIDILDLDNTKKNDPWAKLLKLLVFALVALLLIVGPLGRGLFFYLEVMQAQMLLSTILIAFAALIAKQKGQFPRLQKSELLIGLLLLAYGLSLFKAVHFKDAVMTTVKVIDCVLVYFVVRGLAREARWRTAFVWVLFIGSLAMTLASFSLEFEMILPDPNRFSNIGPFLSPVQYANAYAIVGAVGILLAMGLFEISKLPAQLFLALGMFLNGTGILLAGSRATWVLLLLALPAGIFLGQEDHRWQRFYLRAALLLAALVTSKHYLDAVAIEGDYHKHMLILGIGSAATLALTTLIVLAPHWLERLRLKPAYRLVLPWLLAIALVLMGAFYINYTKDILPQGGGIILSGDLIEQTQSISGQDASLQDRIRMSKTAWRIMLDHPFWGTGGAGWNAMYHLYQERFYWSSEVHNHFLQTGVESGFLGFIAYTGFWLLLLLQTGLHLIRRRGQSSWNMMSNTALATLVFLLHTAMDFELSMMGVAFLLWTLGAILQNQLHHEDVEETAYATNRRTKNKIIGPIAAVLCIAIAAISFPFSQKEYQAQAYVQEGKANLDAGYYEEAIAPYEEAAALSPRTGETAANLAQLYAYQYAKTKDPQYKDKAYIYCQKAVEYSPHYVAGSMKLAQAYRLMEDQASLRKEVRRMTEIAPMMRSAWLDLARSEYAEALAQREAGNEKQAQTLLKECVVFTETAAKNYRLSKQAGNMKPDAALYLIGGQSAAILGQSDVSEAYLTEALKDGKSKKEAGLWLTALYQYRNQEKYEEYNKTYLASHPENQARFEQIRTMFY